MSAHSTTLRASFRGDTYTVELPYLHQPTLDGILERAPWVSGPAARKCLGRQMAVQLASKLAAVRKARGERKARKAGPCTRAACVRRWQAMIDQSADARRLLRRLAGVVHGWGIEVHDGSLSGRGPTLVGRGAWHRWLGKYKTYPGSYQHSTRRIQVGIDWLREHYTEAVRAVTETHARRGRPEHYPYVSWSQELVRQLIASCGWMAVLEYMEGSLIARTEAGELWKIDDATTILRVRCPSTGSEYALRVPPSMTDPETARRWTLGVQGDDTIIMES